MSKNPFFKVFILHFIDDVTRIKVQTYSKRVVFLKHDFSDSFIIIQDKLCVERHLDNALIKTDFSRCFIHQKFHDFIERLAIRAKIYFEGDLNQ